MRPDVIILGAGASGLAAAKSLSQAGRSALILEARNRIGGRILTHRDSKLNIPIELGAEFIHGRPDVTFKLLREATQLAIDLPFEHRQPRKGRLVKLQVDQALAEVMGGLTRLGPRDMSFADYLRSHPHGSAEARKFAINFVEGFDAADPERISAKSIAEEQEGIGDTSDEMQFRPIEGYHALLQSICDGFDRKRIAIRLRTAVSEIRWRKSEVEVITSGKRPSVFRAKRLIVTLPVGVLQVAPEHSGAIHFVPDIPTRRQAAQQLASGPIVKAVLRFSEAFWEDSKVARSAKSDETLRDAVFLHVPDAPFPTWWTLRPLRVPILTAWAGGPAALKLAGLSKRELTDAAIASLSMLFHIAKPGLRSMLEDVQTHDWINDPFSRGAYSYVTTGGMQARKYLATPIQNTLFFAGEATDTSGQASTVAGAFASGQRAAKEVLRTR